MPCNALAKTNWLVRWASRGICPTWLSTLKLGPFLLVYILSAGTATSAKVDANIAGLCDLAAAVASRSKGVPLEVLRAISRTETGRGGKYGLQPWPWTVNMEGTGRWFATLDEARSYVFLNFKNGARSFDVGCFQINYKWHGQAFRSIDDMFDPQINAKYAAKYLLELYQEFGNWPDAVGAYHSRTPALAEKYTARFDRILAGLSATSPGMTTGQNAVWPLPGPETRATAPIAGPRPLVLGGTVALGSLVPIVRQPGVAPRPFVILN